MRLGLAISTPLSPDPTGDHRRFPGADNDGDWHSVGVSPDIDNSSLISVLAQKSTPTCSIWSHLNLDDTIVNACIA